MRSAALAFFLAILSAGPAYPWKPAPRRIPPLTRWQVLNAEYLTAFDGRRHKLSNGRHESGKMSQGNYISISSYKTAFGDMDGDGTSDAVVLLAVSGGGSGTFHELAVLLNKGGKPVYAATKRGLGDRNIVNSLSIAKRIAAIEMKVAGPNDPACCPTKKVRWKFRLKWDKRLKYRVIQVR